MTIDRPQAPRRRPAELVSSHSRPKAEEPIEDLAPDEVVEEVSDVERVEKRLATFEERVEWRFNTFHGELSLIRATLTDLVPRMGTVEQKTLPQKVGAGAVGAGKWTLYVSGVLLLLNTAAKQWPELASVAKWLNENASLIQ